MIQNVLKGSNPNPKPQTNDNNNHIPSEILEPHSVDIKQENNTSVVEETASRSEYGGVGSRIYRRYLTPQLTSELSAFSGLSLRLEENIDAKEIDKFANFPLRKGKPFVIGVCGGNCAGKMDLVNYLVDSLGPKRCTILKQENFYISPDQDVENYNYDDPEATDWQSLEEGLDALLYHLKPFHTPIYNFKLQKRDKKTQEVWPNPIIIVEGLLIFHIEGIRKRLDLKVFLDTDDDIRLSRRIMKGYLKLGRDVDSIVDRYKKFVKPCHEKYVLPSRKFADIIVPNFGGSVCEELENIVRPSKEQSGPNKNGEIGTYKVNIGVALLVEQIRFQLEEIDKIRLFQQKA